MKRFDSTMVLVAFVALCIFGIGVAAAQQSLSSHVDLDQVGGTITGNQYSGSGVTTTSMTACVETGMTSVKPITVSEDVDNAINQAGTGKDEDASIANKGKVTNNGGWIPTSSARLDFDNDVYQTASGTALKVTSGEVNQFAADGNIHDIVIDGDNNHYGSVYGPRTSEKTTQFNRADVVLTPSSCWYPSKADIDLSNKVRDDPAYEQFGQTNVVAGDPWTGMNLNMAKAGTIDTDLFNDAISGASDENAGEQFNVGYLGGNFNYLDATNKANMFPTGLKTTVGSTQGNEGHTAGIKSVQKLDNFGTLSRALLGTTTSATSNDYSGIGTTTVIAGTVVTIS